MASSSSDDSEPENYVFYKDRDDFEEVTPIPQDEGTFPIVAIAYSDEFTDVYNYFRAILRSGEKSKRALELTSDAIRMNSANYTVWHYRRLILRAIEADLLIELQYITKTIKVHPKNYQVWYHRQMVVKWLDDPSQELEFTADVLLKDAKNYHAWQHRQWVIKTFGLWEGELNFVEKLIAEDIRNNSAWNERYFVVANTTDFTEEIVKREVKYTLEVISRAKNNESPWNYLRGIISLSSFEEQPSVRDFCNELYEQQCRSPHLLSIMVDMCEELLKSGKHQAELDRALELCAELAMEYDTVRAAYWTFVAERLENDYRIKQ